MKHGYLLLMVIGLVVSTNSYSQTGPLSPSVSANNASVGTNAWSNTNNIFTSDNARAAVATKGTSNYLVGTNFGFTIPGPAAIDGIEVGIEKRTTGSSNVAVLDNYSTGLTKTVSAGTNRYLVVFWANENGDGSRDLTQLTYGGIDMVQIDEIVIGNAGGFNARVEVWGLDEAGISAAGSNVLTPTYGAYTALEYCEIFSSISLQNVDQTVPVYSQQTSGTNSAVNPHQLSASIATLAGGISLNGVMCGNTGTYTINSTYTEGTDSQFAAATGAGATLQTAYKLAAANGTEQPSCTFSTGVNRWVMIGIHLQKARELDSEVRVVKLGVITGNNNASAAAWPTTEAYTTYGGAADLWGLTWTLGEVNSAIFGTAISTLVTNGTSQVDHMRITVYSHSTLPIELLDFTAEKDNSDVLLKWVTATEINNDYFMIQRSENGIDFQDIGIQDGAGNSNSVLFYDFRDEHPLHGTSYYRLKQVDFDGSFEYSPIRSVDFTESDVMVYPNPSSSGILTVYNNNLEINEVAVYSTDMKLVKRNTYSEETNPIVNIENLATGTYF